MSYQVLARKWRPTNFKQMVGQEHVLQALIHALESQRLHHAYLFTGTRGVGKTTIARILARCLSCEKGITAEPCGTCGACTAIEQGRYVDLIEIDAASRTKVEDMRELLENVQYAPTEGRFKIYLIDEVHMLSTHSFNALLKTLEEPPEHVKFLFATTDPQKLPITILSRCLQFNLKNMTPEKIVHHLKYVLSEEDVSQEEGALWALARAADGSMRDALSLTDQSIAYTQGKLDETSVSSMLGTVDQKKVYRLLDTLLARDAAALLAVVAELAEFSPNYASVLEIIVSVLHRVAIEQAVPGATDNSQGDRERISRYAQNLSPEDVQLYYQISLVARKDLAITPDARAGFEMALLRMLAFQMELPSQAATESLGPVVQHSEVAQAPLSQEAAAIDAPVTEPVSIDTVAVEPTYESENPNLVEEPPLQEPPANVERPSEDEVRSEQAQVYQQVPAQTPSPEPTPIEAVSNEVPAISAEPVARAEIATAPSDTAEKKTPELADVSSAQPSEDLSAAPDLSALDWPRQALRLGLTGMTQNLLMNMVKEVARDALTMYVESGHYRLFNESHKKKIVQALQSTLDWDGRIDFVDGLKSGQETPAMWRERMQAERLREATSSLRADPNVQQLIAEFDGRMLEESVVALSPIE